MSWAKISALEGWRLAVAFADPGSIGSNPKCPPSLDGQEQRKILKPVRLRFCKRVEIRAAATVTDFLEIFKGLFNQRVFKSAAAG
jgi:hypothetical protein